MELKIDEMYKKYDLLLDIVDGELVFKEVVHKRLPHTVKVNYFSYGGKPMGEVDCENQRPFMFNVECDGIDQTLVKKVRFPELSYDSTSKSCFVEITCNVYDVDGENEEIRKKFDAIDTSDK